MYNRSLQAHSASGVADASSGRKPPATTPPGAEAAPDPGETGGAAVQKALFDSIPSGVTARDVDSIISDYIVDLDDKESMAGGKSRPGRQSR